MNCFDHVIKSCFSSLSLFALEDKETEKLDTSLSFVQHGVALKLMAHSFENVYDFIPVSESKGGEKRLEEVVFK